MTPEARAARERKQKIFVVVGGLLLVGLLAIQLPKLLGGSSDPATATSADPEAVGQEATSSDSGAISLVVASAAASGKITSFSTFRAKDPFVPQVVVTTAVGQGEIESAPAAGDAAKAAKAAKSAEKTFSTRNTPVAAATIVTVNGARQVVEPGMKFPSADPLFVLVAERPGSKSVVIAVAGGAYTGGSKTASVKVGKPLTLVNTTTGARYRIALVSVGSGGEQPAQPEQQP